MGGGGRELGREGQREGGKALEGARGADNVLHGPKSVVQHRVLHALIEHNLHIFDWVLGQA